MRMRACCSTGSMCGAATGVGPVGDANRDANPLARPAASRTRISGDGQCDGCGQRGEHQRAHTRDTGRTGQDGMLFVETVGLTAGERHGRPHTVHATIPVRVQFTGQLQPARRRLRQLMDTLHHCLRLFAGMVAVHQPLPHVPDAGGELLLFPIGVHPPFGFLDHLVIMPVGMLVMHLDLLLTDHHACHMVTGCFVGRKLHHVAFIGRQPLLCRLINLFLGPLRVFGHQIVRDAVQMIVVFLAQPVLERTVQHPELGVGRIR